MGGMRGGSPQPDKPLRGNEKTAHWVIDQIITIANEVVKERVSEDAAVKGGERYLITNGLATYLKEANALTIVKYIGPASLFVGVGLWGYRCYEEMQERAMVRLAVPRNSVIERMRSIGGNVKQSAPAPAPGPVPDAEADIDTLIYEGIIDR